LFPFWSVISPILTVCILKVLVDSIIYHIYLFVKYF
jgi:hypothetical protein